MAIITKYGIFLPDGTFVENSGDGHKGNAKRLCDKYEPVKKLQEISELNLDEFMIEAGCALIGAYMGETWFKVAKDNPSESIKKLTSYYQSKGYKIWSVWKINMNAYEVLNEAICSMKNTIEDDGRNDNMEIVNPVGFIIKGKLWPNENGHESTAREIIRKNGWLHEWYGDAQDYLLKEKGAIQLGSGRDRKIIMASREYYNESKIERIIKKYKLYGYEVHLLSY